VERIEGGSVACLESGKGGLQGVVRCLGELPENDIQLG
jgi:hypothetical protein